MSFLNKYSTNGNLNVSTEGLIDWLKKVFQSKEGKEKEELAQAIEKLEYKSKVAADVQKLVVQAKLFLNKNKAITPKVISNKEIVEALNIDGKLISSESELLKAIDFTTKELKSYSGFKAFLKHLYKDKENQIKLAIKNDDDIELDSFIFWSKYFPVLKKYVKLNEFDGKYITNFIIGNDAIGVQEIDDELRALRQSGKPAKGEVNFTIENPIAVLDKLNEYFKAADLASDYCSAWFFEDLGFDYEEYSDEYDDVNQIAGYGHDFEYWDSWFSSIEAMEVIVTWIMRQYGMSVSNEGILDSIKGLFVSSNPKLKELKKKIEKSDDIKKLFREELESIKNIKVSNISSKLINDKHLSAVFNKYHNRYTKSNDIVNLISYSVNNLLDLKYINDFTDKLSKFYEVEWKKVIQTMKPFDNVKGINQLIKSTIKCAWKEWRPTSVRQGYSPNGIVTHWGLGNEHLTYIPTNKSFFWHKNDIFTERASRSIESCKEPSEVIDLLSKLASNIDDLFTAAYPLKIEDLINRLTKEYESNNLSEIDKDGVLASFLNDISSSMFAYEEIYYYIRNQLKCFLYVIAWIKESVITDSKESYITFALAMEDEDDDVEDDSDDSSNEDAESSDDTEDETSDENDDESLDDEAGDSDDESDDDASEDEGNKEETPEEFEEKTEVVEPGKDEERRAEREVDIDEPDEEKVKIKTYLEPLAGDNIDELTLYSAKEVNRPLYHISMNPNITAFVPQVSKRTLGKEDRSIPRVSTSTSLIGCFNGYQSLVSDMDGRAAKNFSGIFKVYQLPFQYAVKPSRRILPDVDISDEYWLVPWKKETYAIHPSVSAEFTVPKIEKVYGSDGNIEHYHLYIKVLSTLYIDHEIKLDPGYYYVTIFDYNYKCPLENNKDRIQIEEIEESEYRKVMAMSMMVKKR